MTDYRTDPTKRRGELRRLARNFDHARRAAARAQRRGHYKRAATYLDDATHFYSRYRQLGGRAF